MCKIYTLILLRKNYTIINFDTNSIMISLSFSKKMIGLNASDGTIGNGCGSADSINKSYKPIKDQKEMKTKNTTERPQEMKKSKDGAKKARIYNLIIVDESGSMESLKKATMDGVNETIKSIRSAQREFADTQEHFLTLVTFKNIMFSKNVHTLINRMPISEVGDFNNYQPGGCTPLYDAMGKSLTELYKYIKDDEDATAVVTVLTDGYENASRKWSGDELKDFIEKLTHEGWSFSYMGSEHDVKQVSFNLSINNVIEFNHDVDGVGSSWDRESSAKINYFRKMDKEYRHGRRQSKEEWLERKRQMASNYYENRVTPDNIYNLHEGEVFVFGSNPQGLHSGGAARVAMERFGAIRGQGEGLQGKSYAIPTTCPLKQMAEAVQRFALFADKHPELRFLVTRVGCGIAGHNIKDVAPLFKCCVRLENVALPAEFWEVFGLKM